MPTVLESLNTALHRAFAADEHVLLLGEDVLDPYGGAFKVTRGLSTTYPDRVITTPISEASLVGVAAGMALRGLRPVVEIMFGDFVTLIADQLINHAAKFRWMYNDQVRVPMVIRTPMGGRRGYGPTHSQTLEKLFLGAPGLSVLAPTDLGSPGVLLEKTILNTEDPVLFVENKLLYLLPVQSAETLPEFDILAAKTGGITAQGLSLVSLSSATVSPTYILRLKGAPPPVLTIAAYGHMAALARQAVLKLAYEYEIFGELIVPTRLSPFEIAPIAASAQITGRLLAAEEGTLTLGWGAEVVARVAETVGLHLKTVRRLGARDFPIPASGPLEAAILPGVNEIIAAAQQMIQLDR